MAKDCGDGMTLGIDWTGLATRLRDHYSILVASPLISVSLSPDECLALVDLITNRAAPRVGEHRLWNAPAPTTPTQKEPE